jgi:hypothetical protein
MTPASENVQLKIKLALLKANLAAQQQLNDLLYVGLLKVNLCNLFWSA